MWHQETKEPIDVQRSICINTSEHKTKNLENNNNYNFKQNSMFLLQYFQQHQ
jgi:hypothetical protein